MLRNKTAVIKYGGHAMESPELRKRFMKDLLFMQKALLRVVLVHGGGPQINELLAKMKIKSSFINGLRVTDSAALEVVEMALCGQVNKSVVREALAQGIKCAGVSGEDGNLLTAEQVGGDLGYVGSMIRVRPELLNCLLDDGFMPIVAPLALDEKGQLLNVNADEAAAAIAGALQADYFILLSNVPGVLDEEGNLLERLDFNEIEQLKSRGVIKGGMIPKVDSCRHACECGCEKALIADPAVEGALRRFICRQEALGTVIRL